MPDTPPVATTVTIQTVAEPALVAFRDERSTTWQSLPVTGKTTFEVHPTGLYRVVVVCRTPRSAHATQYGRALEDGGTLTHACGAPVRPLTVRGALAQPGRVILGDYDATSSAAGWKFELAVAPGTYDLATLVGNPVKPDRIAMRRDVVVSADLDLGAIDAGDAQDLVAVTFTPTNKAASEVLTSYTSFDSGQGGFHSFVHDGSWTGQFVPTSLLRATDQQSIQLGAYTADGALRQLYREVGRAYHDGDPTEVTLPAAVAPVRFQADGDRLSVALPEMPLAADAELSTQTQVSGNDAFRSQTTRLSSKFLHAAVPTSIAVDFTDVPGFLAEWKLADAGIRIRSFSSTITTGLYDRTLSGVSETFVSTDVIGGNSLASAWQRAAR